MLTLFILIEMCVLLPRFEGMALTVNVGVLETCWNMQVECNNFVICRPDTFHLEDMILF